MSYKSAAQRKADKLARKEELLTKYKTVSQPMHVFAEYAPDEVFQYVAEDAGKHPFVVGDQTFNVGVESVRLQCLKLNRKCVRCGIEGTVVRLETGLGQSLLCQPHFNLYHIRDDGVAVLLTKDHILPHSRGGGDHLGNMQTMCCICNSAKGSKLESELSATGQ